MQVLSEDVSTFLILAPEGEYLGAKVQGFIPREDGGLSALEMHGQVSSGGESEKGSRQKKEAVGLLLLLLLLVYDQGCMQSVRCLDV